MNEEEELEKEYLRRLILWLGTGLSAKNKIRAIGTLAVPVHRYNFEIINWRPKELSKLLRKRGNCSSMDSIALRQT